jgi:hypothetical protein
MRLPGEQSADVNSRPSCSRGWGWKSPSPATVTLEGGGGKLKVRRRQQLQCPWPAGWVGLTGGPLPSSSTRQEH